MDQDQNQPMPPQPSSEAQVGFPAPHDGSKEKKGGIVKWIIAIVGILLIVGLGTWFILRGGPGDTNTTASPTPQSGGNLTSFATPEPTETPTPEPTATPEPVEKSELRVEVLNGTGTPGDAGLVKAAMEELGFEDVSADNADEQDETTTTVTYSRDLDPAIIDEIVEALEAIFDDVDTRKGTVAGDFDIRILTGEKGSSTGSSDTSDADTTDDSTSE